MAEIQLSQYGTGRSYRFVDAVTGKPIEILDIVAVIDEATGDYVGYKVEDERPVFDDDGRPVMVNGSANMPIRVHEIGKINVLQTECPAR